MKSGTVSALAGNGEKGVPADGTEATKAPLVDPRAATMDSKGNVVLTGMRSNDGYDYWTVKFRPGR